MGNARERAQSLLREARSVVVFTGAGMSAESGIATYRSGDNALWTARHFEMYANPRGYRAHLPASYAWYRERASTVAAAQPNAGHRAVARLAALVSDLVVVTQNVDGLHLRAGSPRVLELHGHLREARCVDCGVHLAWTRAPEAPVCADCGGMLRPCVVMFEEMLDEAVLQAAQDAARGCDVLISVGTSNQVWPARELPLVAAAAGAEVIVVNTDLDGQPSGQRIMHLSGRAGDILPALVSTLEPMPSIPDRPEARA